MLTYIIIAVLLFALELTYFRIADYFNIIDRPNERSSHRQVVLRGGGIIFTFSIWLWAAFYGCPYTWFVIGLSLIALISFIDDIRPLPDSLRLLFQFSAMALMFADLGLLRIDAWWMLIIALILCVGITNAYNFMDGINGITGGYSLAVLLPLLWLDTNGEEAGFVEPSLLVIAFLATFVFCYFNFRTHARCFAGDVGSVGIAFIIVFALGRLIIQSQDITYLILLALYGVDSVLTICHRIMLHENLGKAHRKHMYQLLANELRWPHIYVSTLYMVTQLAVSAWLLLLPEWHWVYAICILITLCTIYLLCMKNFYHLHQEYLDSLNNASDYENHLVLNPRLFKELLAEAKDSPRLRASYDLRNTSEDQSQRMLNALIPGTEVPIHRHPTTKETIVVLLGQLTEIYFDEEGCEITRIHLSADKDNRGLQIPSGQWHTVEVTTPCVIMEVKDGPYQPVKPEDIIQK